MTTLDSKAVHELVDSLPASQVVGYTCISKDNPLYINKLLGDGTWEKTPVEGIGSTVAKVGVNGNETKTIRYLNAEQISEAVTPFFGSGNDMTSMFAVTWVDRIVLLRRDSDNSDMIIVMGNGDVIKRAAVTAIPVGAVVDAMNNLWVASDAGLLKLAYNEPEGAGTIYKASDGSMPFVGLSHITVNGNEIWVIQNATNDMKIAHFNGAKWTELTDAFFTDTGITPKTGLVVGEIHVDSDGLLLISLKTSVINFNKLYTYSGTTFGVKAIPTGLKVCKFLKIGNIIYHISEAGDPSVWNYDTLEIIPSDNLASTGKCFASDGTEVIYIASDATIYKARVGVNESFTEDTALELQLTIASEDSLSILGVVYEPNKRVYLNDGNAHAIIKGELMEGWVEV